MPSPVRTIEITNKTMFALSGAALAGLVGGAVLFGMYWERQTRDHSDLAVIQKDVGEIKTKVSAMEATFNMIVRRQVRIDFSERWPQELLQQ